MHMADALLAPAMAATMYVASGATTGISVSKLKKDENVAKLPTMAVSAALVFAGQMINYTIPGTGSSGHLCGGMLLSALLGPFAGFLSMVVILTIQCLFFADGGLMALGANCWNMAFYGCFVGYFLIWRPIMRSNWFEGRGVKITGIDRSGSNDIKAAGNQADSNDKRTAENMVGSKAAKVSERMKVILASVIGCVVTLQLGAFSVVLETSMSGITELPFGAFMALMQPIHLAIGLVEGLVTAAVLVFVFESRPELLMEVNSTEKGIKNKLSLKTTIITLGVVTLLVGGIFSLFASSNPDGLEWSLFGNEDAGYSANMALDEEDFGLSSKVSEVASSVQDATAFLPDYAFANSDSAAGTTVSGIVGSVIVAAFAVCICMLGGFFRKKKNVRN